MKISDRVKALRKKLGLTQKEFAKKTDIPLRTLAGIEYNERKPGYDLLMKLCKIARTFNVPIQWLMFGEAETKEVPIIASEPREEYETKTTGLIAIPVINDVPAGYPEVPTLDDEIRDYVYISKMPKDTFGLYVRGDSMMPELNDGDIVIVNPTMKNFSSGDLGVFRLAAGSTIKYYYKEGNNIWLQPRNPKYPSIILTDEIECIAIGKVIWKIIKVK